MITLKAQMVRRIGRGLLMVPVFVIGQTCTELTEIPHDALTPDNPRIRVLAISLAAEEGESVIPVQPLYDDFSKQHRNAWVFSEDK